MGAEERESEEAIEWNINTNIEERARIIYLLKWVGNKIYAHATHLRDLFGAFLSSHRMHTVDVKAHFKAKLDGTE